MKLIPSFVLCFAIAGASPAQQLSVSISPNPAPLGASITLQANAAYGTLFTPGGCLVTAIRSGSPTGPVVRNFPCTFLAVAIPICGSASPPRQTIWNQAVTGGTAAPGDYWFQIQHSPAPFGATTTEFFCVRIDGAIPGPTLSAPAAPTWNSFFSLNINAPLYPTEFFVVALSGSTNVGIPLGPGQLLCLDDDFLLSLSFPMPIALFQGFQSYLDGAGQSAGVGIQFPANPGLICFPFHAQAAILPVGGGIVLTNELSLSVM